MISSTSNKQVKELIALIKKSKERKEKGLFIVEGPKMCFEAPFSWIVSLYVSESFLEDEELKEKFFAYMKQAGQQSEISYEILSDSVFKAVSDTQTPQGILAVLKMPKYELSDLLKGEKTLLLVLESIQDPGNLGTMIRTGEGAGITGVIMNQSTVDLFNPKTIRSTMGSIYRIPYVVTENLAKTVQELKEKQVTLYAAHLKGALSYDEPDYVSACGFMIGNEGNGLTTELADLASSYIRIPMEGQVESLNAAISASLLMYETNRQRRKKL